MDGDSSDSDENRNNMNCFLIDRACLNRFADYRYAFLCFNRFLS